MQPSQIFTNFLKLAAALFIGAGCMHVTLGLQADLMLGAGISEQTLLDPGLDSQNRFYGAAFTLYGVLLFIIVTDLERFAPILRALLWVLLVAGLVRFLSVWKFGWPAPLIGLLFALEILVPPLVLFWFSRVENRLVD